MLTRLDALGMDRPQPGLERVEAVLAHLHHPERCAPAVHIAGTNGKGSTLAFLDALALAAGQKTARLTSPHLIHVGERLRLNGQVTALAEMERALEEAWAVPGGESLTYFESVVIASFLLAQNAHPDVLLVETGLGGRWDATNVVDTRLHLFSPIDIDHTAYLGDSLAAIAAEKGGIVRSPAPVISAPQQQQAQAPLVLAAQSHDAPWRSIQSGRDFRGSWRDAQFNWRGQWLSPVKLPLPGDHQVINAALAVAAAAELFPHLDADVVLDALVHAHWEGRLERCHWRLPDGGEVEVVMDGAHNPAGMAALTSFLRANPPVGRTRIVLGVMGDKDVVPMLAYLEAVADVLMVVGWDEPRALDQQGWSRLAPHLPFVGDPLRALEQVLANSAHGDRVVVVGSLHLLGWMRRRWTCPESV